MAPPFHPVNSPGRVRPFQWIALLSSSVLLGLGMPACAQPVEMRYTLATRANQSFAALMQQAESVATTAIQQTFTTTQPEVTTISIQVSGEHHGLESPLLFVMVARSDWQKRPDVRAWARYFSSSKLLLGFVQPPVVPLIADTTPTVASDREPNFYR